MSHPENCDCGEVHGLSRRRFLELSAGLLLAAGSAVPVTAATAAASAPDLDNWLATNPAIAENLVFAFADGAPTPFADWPVASKLHLRGAFLAAWTGKERTADTPPNVATLKDTDIAVSDLGSDDAFAMYCTLVGHSLAMEIGRRLPWSIASDNDEALAELFDSRRLLQKLKGTPRYALQKHGVPAAPMQSLAFIAKNDLIGKDRRSTIVKLLQWCSDCLFHFDGPPTAGNFENYWHYRGFPPAVQIIKGTTFAGSPVPKGLDVPHYFTAGCFGTTAFLSGVLRAVNIAVVDKRLLEFNRSTGKLIQHSGPYFPSEGVGLSHGDDPYNAVMRIHPSVPVEDLLVDQAQLESWFPADKPPTAQSPANVGRQVYVLAINKLPIVLLDHYADDLLAKRAKENGQVLKELAPYFSLAELDQHQLWERLDQRVAQLGGAKAVIALFQNGEKASAARQVAPAG